MFIRTEVSVSWSVARFAQVRVLFVAICLTTFCFSEKLAAQVAVSGSRDPVKVIVDTDIGTDIDDAFAVALALKSQDLNVLGFSTASGDTARRAKILDEMLGSSGHTDIPVAVGNPTTLPFSIPPVGRQVRYGEEGHFARTTHPSSADLILAQIRRFPGEITLVALGPLTNIGELIDKDPQTFRQLKCVVMMGGSIGSEDWGGAGSTDGPTPEYNISGDIQAAQKLFQSGVPIYVMPIDSTAQLKLDEVKRDALLTKGTPLTDSLALLYLMWGSPTPVLFDAMAIAYVLDPKLCPVEPMHITVDDKGVTRSEPGSPNAQVCMHSDPESFFHFFMARMN
jgi:inosine-uridine nucleoside N-ribohydrolase